MKKLIVPAVSARNYSQYLPHIDGNINMVLHVHAKEASNCTIGLPERDLLDPQSFYELCEIADLIGFKIIHIKGYSQSISKTRSNLGLLQAHVAKLSLEFDALSIGYPMHFYGLTDFTYLLNVCQQPGISQPCDEYLPAQLEAAKEAEFIHVLDAGQKQTLMAHGISDYKIEVGKYTQLDDLILFRQGQEPASNWNFKKDVLAVHKPIAEHNELNARINEQTCYSPRRLANIAQINWVCHNGGKFAYYGLPEVYHPLRHQCQHLGGIPIYL